MIYRTLGLCASLLLCSIAPLQSKEVPEKILTIMQQDKYRHANWTLFVKDLQTNEIIYDINSNNLVLPASTTKLFSVAALLNALGDDFRFKTPVYADGPITNGVLKGDLILVGQGDLTLGGRQIGSDKIDYTKMDHIYANTVPGAILTKEDPLFGIKNLAKQIKEKGVKEIIGNVLVDERLFEKHEARGMSLTPVIINDNLIDFTVNPTKQGDQASVIWRPQVSTYTVDNQVVTGASDSPVNLEATSDESGKKMVITGSIPANAKDVVHTIAIKNVSDFARHAFLDALRAESIVVKESTAEERLPSQEKLKSLKPIAEWTSPPLYEYAKLILKVSHNLGAELVPLLLAVHNNETTYDKGMLELGKFVTETAKISADSFVFGDAAGGDENRLTPQAEVEMLRYMHGLGGEKFTKYYEGLPILGVDGSLEDVAKNTQAKGKVYAKTGTGVSFNLATGKFFLTTQTLAGYINGKNGHLYAFMLGVNNGLMPVIEDIFAIFEDEGQIASIIYEGTSH